jgi:hypothetical protein
MMFEENLSLKVGTRRVDDAFVGHRSYIRRLDQKIGCRRIPQFASKKPNFSNSYLFTKSSNPCLTTHNTSLRHLAPTFEDKFFLNIIGSRGRILFGKSDLFLNNPIKISPKKHLRALTFNCRCSFKTLYCSC